MIHRPPAGSGFVSKSAYHHGFFSASIKLPDDDTAGVVVAFYVSRCFLLHLIISTVPQNNSIELVKKTKSIDISLPLAMRI